jgi:redox-sensitive bicupin YhaK (pirin superfamily)
MILLSRDDYVVLGESDFGTPGLTATEIIGPFVPLQATGPLIMVHDAFVEASKGIGHHPHRYNERLFYILEGSLSHDDSLNRITGFMGKGDVARLTEGETGMLHKEWNDTGERTHAFILVYETRPVPERASFAALRDADAPRYEEAPGVTTKELVGPLAGLEVNGDIRAFADSAFEAGSELTLELGEGEGALLFPLEGEIAVDPDTVLLPGNSLVVPPSDEPRRIALEARTASRLLRAVHGPGRGLVTARPRLRRTGA